MPGTTISERSSHPSPVPSPSWPPPRNPLPPHRLAKLANALGVSTPLPAIHAYAPSPSTSPPLPHSSASASFPDYFRRSPTPSTTSAQTFTSHPPTRFLLHVIPPLHLPHEPDASDDLELSPPPPTASGYHVQFRRGVLVPVCPTLHSQLSAIAKEYSLPSTAGMLLYLVTSAPSPKHDLENGDTADEPGPRISEDIWRHIWLRVIKTEKDEAAVVTSPRPFGLGISSATESSPNLLQDVASNSLLPVIAPRRAETPQPLSAVTPSSSTPSHSIFSSQSEIDTPESITSVSALGAADALADDLPLPGLHSPALIPVLAKVEFDIDRRKAAWYEPWLRSRRINHAKREESRLGVRKRSDSHTNSEGEGEGDETKKAPLDLALVDKLRPGSPTPRFLRERAGSTGGAEDSGAEGAYSQLLESPEDVEFGGDPTSGLNGVHGDPLADVFGTDADTWADVHAQSEGKQEKDPDVVNLALDGGALSAPPDDLEDGEAEDMDEEEVTELWNRHSKPSLLISIPSSPPLASKRRSSPTTAGTIKKQPPPPLNLLPSSQNPDRSRLPYLAGVSPATSESTEYLNGGDSQSGSQSESEEVRELKKSRSPEDEKRDGAFFEDLDLGLEFDEDDPHDHRRSQVMMKAQLDEIERNLAQFSPHQLQTEELPESPRRHTHSASTLSARSQWRSPRLNVDSAASPPQGSSKLPTQGALWPAVPFSALNGRDASLSPPSRADSLPSPPKIAFNGVSTEPPRSPFQRRTRSGTISDETLARKREQEEAALYPPLVTPPLLQQGRSAESPVIPLSPDPFGRFPSEAESVRLSEEQLLLQQHHAAYPGRELVLPPQDRSSFRLNVNNRNTSSNTLVEQYGERPPSQSPSSRFSLDSVTSDEGLKPSKTASIVSMKGLKKLWRKTNNKMSVSGSSTPTLPDSGRSTPNLMPSGQDPQGRPKSRTVSRSPVPGDFVMVTSDGIAIPKKRRPSLHNMQLDADPRYPVPSRTTPLDLSRGPSPQLPPMLSRNHTPDGPMSPPTPSIAMPPPPTPTEWNGSVRKSILKSWKSASGSLSAHSPSNSATTHSSTEQDVPMRHRRPSMLDGISGRRGSSATSVTLVDIPPSPALPDQFANQSRSTSRQSQLNEKRASVRKPSMSSSVSSASPPPRAPSRLNPSSPPQHGMLLTARSSVDSGESRPSFDVSQFEIVSPKLDSAMLEPTLSYPYHALDHSMTSAE